MPKIHINNSTVESDLRQMFDSCIGEKSISEGKQEKYIPITPRATFGIIKQTILPNTCIPNDYDTIS